MEALILSLLAGLGILEIPEAMIRHLEKQALLQDFSHNQQEQLLPAGVYDGLDKKPDTTFDMTDYKHGKE